MPNRVTEWGSTQYLKIIHGLAPRPVSYFVALCTDEPGVSTDGEMLEAFEPDPALGYRRLELPFGPANWADPTIGGSLANLLYLDFGIPGGDWGLVSHFALCDSEMGGEVYCYGEFNDPMNVTSDWRAQVPPGGISLDAGSYEPPMVGF